MRGVCAFLLVLLSINLVFPAYGQYQVVSERLPAQNLSELQEDDASRQLIEEVTAFVEGSEGAFSIGAENELIYFKMTEGVHAKRTVRITRYDDQGALQVFIKTQERENTPLTFVLDASEFYKEFARREKKVESAFFRQYIFSPEPESETASRALWIMKRNGEVISAITAFNLPHITTDKKKENFPSRTVGELISMDIAQVTTESSRKKGR
jgi:hypothetical protein